MEDLICSVQGVTVKYGLRKAVDSVAFSIRPGEGLALLGLNGAGKSTIVRALLGMMPVSAGTVSVLGGPCGRRQLREIGYCPEDAAPPEFLSVREYLSLVAALRITDPSLRGREVDSVATGFELAMNRRMIELSKGMARRVVLAQAFLGRPKLVVLDEPLNGLDPLMIAALRERILEFRSGGGALLYSSHLLAEAELCCSHVLIIKSGRVVVSDALSTILKRSGGLEPEFKACFTDSGETHAH